jgi:hypothetical protein
MLDQWYGIMPNKVLFDKELTDKQKLLFCLISSLCAEKWYCRATNEYLWERLNASKTTISKNVSILQEKWFISVDVSLEEWNKRKIGIVENNNTYCQKWQEGIVKNDNSLYIYKNNINENVSENYSDLYKNYYWKNKWINETVCNKLLDTKIKQWITLEEIRTWMVLYNCECRLKQDFKFVKKFETWIKEFQPLDEQQINEELYAIIKSYRDKKKSDEKFWQSTYAKTLWSDLKQQFGEEKVKWMLKQANSIQLNFT